MAYRKTAKNSATAPAFAKVDAHKVITDKIVELLEQGVRPWSRSWGGGSEGFSRPLRVTGEPYRGINVLVLWMHAQLMGYSSPTWMTYNQANDLGAHVRKGEKGTQIVFYTRKTVDVGTVDERAYSILRTFSVFNCDQIENLPAKFAPKAAAPVSAVISHNTIPHAEAFFDALCIKTSHAGSKAFYVISQDRVQMPNFTDFFTAEAYYATRAHECVHATRHPKRLDREFGQKRFGDNGYAVEELVAELGAAFVMADLGLVNHPREDHAAYIASWLKVLKQDSKAIFTAASFAEKAAKHLYEMAGGAGVVAVDEIDGEDEIEDRIAA